MLPKLIEFDWRLDVKMSQNLSTGESDSLKSAGQQACILQLKVIFFYYLLTLNIIQNFEFLKSIRLFFTLLFIFHIFYL